MEIFLALIALAAVVMSYTAHKKIHKAAEVLSQFANMITKDIVPKLNSHEAYLRDVINCINGNADILDICIKEFRDFEKYQTDIDLRTHSMVLAMDELSAKINNIIGRPVRPKKNWFGLGNHNGEELSGTPIDQSEKKPFYNWEPKPTPEMINEFRDLRTTAKAEAFKRENEGQPLPATEEKDQEVYLSERRPDVGGEITQVSESGHSVNEQSIFGRYPDVSKADPNAIVTFFGK